MKTKFWLLGIVTALVACDKDDTPEVVTGEIKNDAEALAVSAGVYPSLQVLSSSFSFVIESATEGTISFEGAEEEPGPVVSRFETEPTTWYPVKIFNNLYISISAANDAIERVPKAEAVSEATKKLAVGRAKFVRALDYLYLVQLFGEVPLILNPGEASTTRASIDDVYTQIVNDLTEAKELLPEYDASPITPSALAADALLARVYLVWSYKPLSQGEVSSIASGSVDPAPVTPEASLLQKAVEHADNVINSGKYSLLGDFTQLFGRENESKAPEHIITIHHDGDAYDAQGNHQTHCAFTFAFELEQDNHIGPSDVNLYQEWTTADPADVVRRDWSYTTYVENPLEDNKGYHYVPPVTLARFGKGVDRSYENSVNHAITTNEVDRIELRYAEVLLIRAEALAQLGRNAEALSTVNQIRQRAGATLLTTITPEDIQREWGYEFVYEQKHWLNLVRWRTLIASVKKIAGFEHFDDSYAVSGGIGRDGEVVSPFFAKVHKHLHAKYDNVRGKHYRFPIPTGLKGEDLHITPQNPGY
ncbi:MAG: RagB/SusD family nutrient uptake outer membrane protein [Tannerellaceae bacterium]|jgi:hypothetical protein|nr:RagB/SusD family nutrient uptake outer membrane protein [Tannerellaceae bacterium]